MKIAVAGLGYVGLSNAVLLAQTHDVFDVTGAGDTVVALIDASLAAGLGLEEAMRLSNVAAGIVVGKFGIAGVTTQELDAALDAVKASNLPTSPTPTSTAPI